MIETKDSNGPHNSTNKKNNLAAFPRHSEVDGMSLRDWFAGQALAGNLIMSTGANTARYAYEIADAMMEERNKL